MSWKYFTEEEVKGLDPILVAALDMARGICGFPFKITSGYRPPDHNAAIGGVSDSAHTKGKAADIARPKDDEPLYKMIWALGLVGFKRIEIATKHIHVDVDASKPQYVMWFGESK